MRGRVDKSVFKGTYQKTWEKETRSRDLLTVTSRPQFSFKRLCVLSTHTFKYVYIIYISAYLSQLFVYVKFQKLVPVSFIQN